jgi:hypothetical protein
MVCAGLQKLKPTKNEQYALPNDWQKRGKNVTDGTYPNGPKLPHINLLLPLPPRHLGPPATWEYP